MHSKKQTKLHYIKQRSAGQESWTRQRQLRGNHRSCAFHPSSLTSSGSTIQPPSSVSPPKPVTTCRRNPSPGCVILRVCVCVCCSCRGCSEPLSFCSNIKSQPTLARRGRAAMTPSNISSSSLFTTPHCRCPSECPPGLPVCVCDRRDGD